jgi:prepilin-type N-terminal cleavage/methylation domain-containing protein
MSNRRGFTVIELMLSMFMMVIVAGGLYSLMVTVYRVTRKLTVTSNTQANLRAGMQLMQSELQEIYTNAADVDSDILSFSPTALSYDGMRGVGESCGITAGGGAVQVRQASYSGRAPIAGRDRLLLFQDRDTLISTDDVWLEEPITAVAEGSCTIAPGGASWNLTVPSLLADELVDPVGGVEPWVFAPGPVRTVETMELGLVSDGGKDWLGIRAVGAGEDALVPVVGPVSGLEFKYYNGVPAETGLASDVKTIVVKLRGISATTVNTGMGSALGSLTDSIIVRVQLRNSR